MTPDAFIEDVIARIPEAAEFDDVTKEEARRVLLATLKGITDDANSGAIKYHLSGLTNGYGCWLASIHDALAEALAELPDSYGDEYRGRVMGAFQMATYWLFDIEGHDARFDKEEQDAAAT